MSTLAIVLIVIVAGLHLFFLVLEMFLWTRPIGLKIFRNTPERAETMRVLAANQGLYNGFLAAGLLWAAATAQRDVALFFLICVVVAGVYGAATVSRRILYVQALPALAAIAAVFLSERPLGAIAFRAAPKRHRAQGALLQKRGVIRVAATPTSRSARGTPHRLQDR